MDNEFNYLDPNGQIVRVAVVTTNGKTQLVQQPAPTGFTAPEKDEQP
jgi:hypothetical protein